MYEKTNMEKQMEGIVPVRMYREFIQGCCVSCFAGMFFNGGQAIRFNFLF